MFFSTFLVGASSLHPESMTVGVIFCMDSKYKLCGHFVSRSSAVACRAAARTGLLCSSLVLWHTSPPEKTTAAFKELSSATSTITPTGQSSKRQYPLHVKIGACVCDPRVFTLCRLKAKLQYGWMDLMPLAMTFVHWSPCKSLPSWCCLSCCQSLRSMKKKHGCCGNEHVKNWICSSLLCVEMYGDLFWSLSGVCKTEKKDLQISRYRLHVCNILTLHLSYDFLYFELCFTLYLYFFPVY